MNWTHFTDVTLTVVIIITCIIFIAYGHDGTIKVVLGTATGYLFGKSGLSYVQQKKADNKEDNNGQ